MTDDEIENYARELIVEHATDVEYMAVLECFEDWYGAEISEPDALRTHDLISRATVEVSFPWGGP